MNPIVNYRQICDFDALSMAWREVMRKGKAGGVDKVQVGVFKEQANSHLEELQRELTEKTYAPEPYLSIQIPKKNDEKRRLGLLTVRDKIVQQAVLSLIEPLLDREFVGCSYGYRQGKGPVKAVKRVWHCIRHEHRFWLCKLDFDNFFDNLGHDLLEKKLARYLPDADLVSLVMLCVKMGRVNKRLDWEHVSKGVPQGALLSPLLSNLYLHDMDAWIARRTSGYVRYADDFVLLARNHRAAQEMRKEVEDFIQKHLSLPLNEGKEIIPIEKGFEYLGITFYKNHYTLSEEKKGSMKDKITKAVSLESGALPSLFQETAQGIARYYGQVLPPEQLRFLDEHLLDCLRREVGAQRRRFQKPKELRIALEQLTFFTPEFKREIPKILAELAAPPAKLVVQEVKISPEKAVRQKKKEYERRQSAGMELLVSQVGVSLGISREGITVRDRGKNILTAPTANVRHISVVSKGVVISSNLILFCAEKNIPLDFFDEQGKPAARLYHAGSADSMVWVAQLEALRSGLGLELARRFVEGKMSNQLNLMKYFFKYNKEGDPGFAAAFPVNADGLEKRLTELDELPACDLDTLRGKLLSIEGRAASFYWTLVQLLVKDETDFTGRERQGAKDLVNSMLNYGYGILYSRIWDAVLKARLNPYISFMHTHQAGKPTLIYDLIEEFRPVAVDRVVIALVNRKHKLKTDERGYLDKETRDILIKKILERLNSFETFRGTRMRLSEVIRYQAKEVARYVTGEIKTYKPYSFKW